MLDLGIDLDLWPWIWLTIAVAFALIEVTLLGGSFILLPFAASAFIAALLGFYDVAIEVQWAVFLIGGAILWFGFYRWAKRFLKDNVLPPGVGAERLIGLTGIVTAGIDPNDTERLGRIKVAGEVWGATASHDEPLAEGTKVRITHMQGTRVIVEPITADESNSKEDQQ